VDSHWDNFLLLSFLLKVAQIVDKSLKDIGILSKVEQFLNLYLNHGTDEIIKKGSVVTTFNHIYINYLLYDIG
jgi:hypothetical protein